MAKSTANILLRSGPALHKRLTEEAKSRAISLHELCLRRLTTPSSLDATEFDFLRMPVVQAAQLFGSHFLGAVLYGSQARGEGRSSSDWDLLLVLSPKKTINRALYRHWDEACSELDERLETHFVNLPSKTSTATGFWSEIAIDGIVLYDADFQLGHHLTQVRGDILSGRIVRKVANGQSYWVHQEVA